MAIIKNSNIVLSSDIGSVLNDAGGAVNINQPATFFTSAAKINPAAKFKPTQYVSNFDDSNYWKAYDGNCQVNVKVATTLAAIKQMFEGNDTGWNFKYWNVSSTYPYRLGDFRKYKTDAKFPIQGESHPTSANIDSFAPAIIGFNGAGWSSDDYSLKWKDFAALQGIDNFYVSSVYWHESDPTNLKIRTYNSKIENPPYQSSFYASKGGRYYICPVLSSLPYLAQGGYSGNELIPIPGTKLITIDITRTSPIVIDPNVGYMYYDGGSTCQPYIRFRADVTSVGTIYPYFSYMPYDRYSGSYYGTTYMEPSKNKIEATKTGEYIIEYEGSIMDIPEAAYFGTEIKCALLDMNSGMPIFEFILSLVYKENLA